MGKGEYKYVSGRKEYIESGNERIPEREAKGDVYELTVKGWFEDLGLSDKITYHPEGKNGRIDFGWEEENAEIECKYLDLNIDYIYSHSVIRTQILDRSHAPFKLLITSCEKWGKTGKQYLESEGWRVIVTGGIETEAQKKEAQKRFNDGIVDFIFEKGMFQESLRTLGIGG
jgi:hypothetical protein